MVDWGIACLLAANCGSKVRCADNGRRYCAAVLLSVPISYHFLGCTALLVALVVVSGAIKYTPFTFYSKLFRSYNVLLLYVWGKIREFY